MTDMEYILDNLVKVAKRENNTKRNYLYVNPLQGKHIPTDPQSAIKLFAELARMLENKFQDERILVIGFAETATAIGTTVALHAKNVLYNLNTTRESIDGAEYIIFSESHSHATEQRLVINNLSSAINQTDRVVFVEDEVTTGNTIEHLIDRIDSKYGINKIKYGIISIINSMTQKRIEELHSKEIECLYICKLPAEYSIRELNDYVYEPLNTECPAQRNIGFDEIIINGGWNSRIVNEIFTIQKMIKEFVEAFFQRVEDLRKYNSILLLGTEEFMYAAMRIGEEIRIRMPDIIVKTHATTRSPIEISKSEGYPLHTRCRLKSVYDSERVTFIYNLAKYDKVFIITDSKGTDSTGMATLLNALSAFGNNNITVVRWLY